MKESMEGFTENMAESFMDSAFSDSDLEEYSSYDEYPSDTLISLWGEWDTIISYEGESMMVERTQEEIDSLIEAGYFDNYDDDMDYDSSWDAGYSYDSFDVLKDQKPDYISDAVSGLNSMDKVDTTIQVYSTVPDSVLQRLSHPELLKKVYIQIKADKDAEIMQMNYKTDFASLEELDAINLLVGEISGDGNEMQNFMGGQKSYDLNLKEGYVRVPEYLLGDEYSQLGGEDKEEMTEESVKEMLEMFGMDKIVMKYNLPGKFIKSTGAEVNTIDDNTVEVKINFLDLFKNGKMSEYFLYFEKPAR